MSYVIPARLCAAIVVVMNLTLENLHEFLYDVFYITADAVDQIWNAFVRTMLGGKYILLATAETDMSPLPCR